MKSFKLLLVLLLTFSCASTFNEFSNDAIKANEANVYREYINSNSGSKVLVRTKIPVRYIQPTDWAMGDEFIVRNYFSTKQSTILEAFVEAYEYCKKDNPQDFKNICEFSMINNFNSSELEKNYAMNIINSKLFQATILNENINYGCMTYDQEDYKNWVGVRKDQPFFKRFRWKACKMNIRLNLDEILKKYEKPKELIDKEFSV